jgi:uncharacterized protein YuzE
VKTSYDRSTDSRYVEVRPLPARRTGEVAEDVMLGLGADCEPVGYDIQHAATKRDLIARLVLGETAEAAT